MAKKQWSTTYDEEILKDFQATCEEYGMKANVILEALMKYFTEGNCKIIIEKGGCRLETNDADKFLEIEKRLDELHAKIKG